jgi:zinc protease
VQSWTDRIKAVTADAVQQAAQRWLDKRRSVTGYLVREESQAESKAQPEGKRS